MSRKEDENYRILDEINLKSEDSLSFLQILADNKPILTSEEEEKFGRRIKAGIMFEGSGLIGTRIVEETPDGREALDEMVFSNLRLVFDQAKKWAHESPEKMLKYSQAGIIGLTVAALKFDPERGNKFSSTATYWVRNAIKMEVRNEDGRRIPNGAFDEWIEIRKIIETINPDLGDEEVTKEIARQVGISQDKVEALLRSKVSQVSLQVPIEGKDGDDLELGEGMAAEQDSIEEIVIKREKKRLVRKLLGEEKIWGGKKTSERNRLLIQMRAGVVGTQRLTLEEVGEIFSMSKQGVFKVELVVYRRAVDWFMGLNEGREILEGRVLDRDPVLKQERVDLVDLTELEQKIMNLVGSGRTMKEVTFEMKLTEHQTEQLLNSAKKKMQLAKEVEMVRKIAVGMVQAGRK